MTRRRKSKSAFVGAYVDPKTRTEVDRLAKRDDLSRSDVFRRLIARGLEAERAEIRA